MEVMVTQGMLTCAGETLSTLLTSAIIEDLIGMLATTKGENHMAGQSKLVDADQGEDVDQDKGCNGGFGKEDLSSEEGAGLGNNSNSNTNADKGPEGGARVTGEDNDDDDEDDDDDNNGHNDDDDDDHNDDENEDDENEETEEEIVKEEEDSEDDEEEEEEEESIQPSKKRKK